MDTSNELSRGPYDLDKEELAAAQQEVVEFIASLDLGSRPPQAGNYYQKRPGLGVTLVGVDVDCSVSPHKVSSRHLLHAWRTAGEKRFGDSLQKPLSS